ncbi:MAG: hypothetical protein ACOC0U_08200, partial [Desulfovibrionales bacterium]
MKHVWILFFVAAMLAGCSKSSQLRIEQLEAENRYQNKELAGSEEELERLQVEFRRMERKVLELEAKG